MMSKRCTKEDFMCTVYHVIHVTSVNHLNPSGLALKSLYFVHIVNLYIFLIILTINVGYFPILYLLMGVSNESTLCCL
jgi:hypothetical protein